ncbi:MAG: redoxin domain-containing protein [Saprospiraceae bacterium]|jgi:peroxiredoxin|nr:redoxin domain-containing protein [bacterium]MDB4414797.1 redoxin domain-containing protein [bacterium]MDC3209883.1 redoxin domain-containing protein [Saprospiraceae bacterium]MDG1434419.1 redoxin domain-containing protein [Saprospiraceae bacterium]MDG2418519.1 redoxin domain-containing protein [Saprospiraceae bacterium]
MEITVGSQAPNFTLRNTEKAEVSLENYKGKKVVLLFFPLAFTGVCTTELCSMRDDIASYSDLDADILAISVDSLFVLDQFKKVENYNFTLLSDFNKEVSRAYGALYEDFVLDMKGVSKRSAFVIDKEGMVQYAEVLESAGDLPNFEAVKAKLAELK